MELSYIDYAESEEVGDSADLSGNIFDADAYAKGKRFRFRSSHDLALIKQVYEDQPFLAGYGKQEECWNKVAKSMTENLQLPVGVTGRCLHDRFNALMKFFKADDQKKLRSSGTEEDLSEKVQLLTELTELIKSCAERKESQRKQDEIEREIGKQIQADALKRLKEKKSINQSSATSDDGNSNTDVVRKKSKQSDEDQAILDQLDRKEKRRFSELENERLRLHLEEKKIDLDRERLHAETKKAKEASQLERERIQVESQRLAFDRFRFEVELKEREEKRKQDQSDRELQNKLQTETTRVQLEFIANIASKLK